MSSFPSFGLGTEGGKIVGEEEVLREKRSPSSPRQEKLRAPRKAARGLMGEVRSLNVGGDPD